MNIRFEFLTLLVCFILIGYAAMLHLENERELPGMAIDASEVIVPEYKARAAIVFFEWVDADDPVLDDRWGETEYTLNDQGIGVCRITTAEPVFIDDVWSDTLGHELMHCIYGDYHAE